MPIESGTRARWIIIALAVAAGLSVSAKGAQNSTTTISESQQTALVQKYCAVCHDDVHQNGGLSLQHFNASTVEPSLAAMMVSKLNTGAIGAAGIPGPGKATERAFYDALNAKAAGANEWRVTRTEESATRTPLVTANVVRETPSRPDGTKELYRLKLTCRPETREAEMQLTWAPMSAQGRRQFTVTADGDAPITFSLEGRETMGNGAKAADGKDAVSGSASAILYATLSKSNVPSIRRQLPVRSLSITDIFPGEAVMFPFERLTASMRADLSACF